MNENLTDKFFEFNFLVKKVVKILFIEFLFACLLIELIYWDLGFFGSVGFVEYFSWEYPLKT
jgi:hypothetical protein